MNNNVAGLISRIKKLEAKRFAGAQFKVLQIYEADNGQRLCFRRDGEQFKDAATEYEAAHRDSNCTLVLLRWFADKPDCFDG